MNSFEYWTRRGDDSAQQCQTMLADKIGIFILGSDLAFYAIISGDGVTLQLFYCIPILCVVCRGRSIFHPRPYFDFGRWGYDVNIVSLLWSIIVVLFSAVPQYLPVVSYIAVMNRAIAILRGLMVFRGAYWMIKDRKVYLRGGTSLLNETVVVAGDGRITGRDVTERLGLERKGEKQ